MSCRKGSDFDVDAKAAAMVSAAQGLPKLGLTQRVMFEPLRIPLPISIDDLVSQWESYYRERLEANVAKLRDDKLALYSKLVSDAEKELAKSYASTQIWKNVYQQRYGLDGTDWSAATFIENAVQKNVPEDIENISKFIKLRSILVQLTRDRQRRTNPSSPRPTRNNPAAAAADTPPKPRKGRRAGGGAPPLEVGRRALFRDWSSGVVRFRQLLAARANGRVGGANKRKTKKEVADDEANGEDTGADTGDADATDDGSGVGAHAPPNCSTGTELQREKCWLSAYNKIVTKYNGCSKSHGSTERWKRAAWEFIPDLPTEEEQVTSLLLVLMKAQKSLVGRAEILSRIAAIIHTFAHNHCAFSSAYLNFSLEGPPGTGKTTIAQTIGDVFRYLDVILTDKFDVLAREDFVGGFLGETALKTKAVLNNHIEGVILLDEAYSLGAGAGTSSGPDPYGSEAVTSIVGFLDKHQGQIIFMVAGYADRMETEFFGINVGLARRFPYRFYLSPFGVDQLLKMFFQKTLSKVRQEDLPMWQNERTWTYLREALQIMNEPASSPQYLPNQGGDIENIANNTLVYVNTYVRPRLAASRFITVCDMQQILREYLFLTQRANIVLGNNAINAECQSNQECKPDPSGRVVCAPLIKPNTALVATTNTTTLTPNRDSVNRSLDSLFGAVVDKNRKNNGGPGGSRNSRQPPPRRGGAFLGGVFSGTRAPGSLRTPIYYLARKPLDARRFALVQPVGLRHPLSFPPLPPLRRY